MIGKGYLSILFTVTTIVLLSNFIASAQTVPSTTSNTSDTANATGTFSADLTPRQGSSGTGKVTLELQDDGKKVKYDVSASGLGNVSGVTISQETGSGRAPDVVALKTASQSGLKAGGGSLSGAFTKSDLIGPLKDKDISDFVKAINDGKIIFRVSTTAFPLGEVIGNVTAGGGAGTATNATANATGTATNEANELISAASNASSNATGAAVSGGQNIVSTAQNATANATGAAGNQTEGNPVLDALKNIFGGIMENK